MNLNVRITLHWTSDGPEGKPAWVTMPRDMPYYGTPEFSCVEVRVYIVKSFAMKEPYTRFAAAVAHELSHVVLRAIDHPLKEDEKAVDLTAMILGFSDVYRRSVHMIERTGWNSFLQHPLGYLSEDEMDAACRLLLPFRLRARHAIRNYLVLHTRTVLYMLLLGAIFLLVWLGPFAGRP